jgi:hypothetical protein
MSIQLRHDAYSLDSQQTELFWWDDFLGDTIKDEWTISGTANVNDDSIGGAARLTTGITLDNYAFLYINYGTATSLSVLKNLAVEMRFSLITPTYSNYELNPYKDSDNQIYIDWSDGNGDGTAQITLVSKNGGSATSVSGNDAWTPGAGTYYINRIQTSTYGSNHIHFYLDNTELSNSPITTNIPTATMGLLAPYLRTKTSDERTMDVDYVGVRQLI